jgi:hypothetical protein
MSVNFQNQHQISHYILKEFLGIVTFYLEISRLMSNAEKVKGIFNLISLRERH